jgi:hypothetical protein
MNASEEMEADAFVVPFDGFYLDQNGRRSSAKPFSCMRMAAPYDGRTAPPESAFCPVRCCELSRDGISFLSPVRPGSEHFVLRLNDREQPAFLVAARVISCSEYNTEDVRGFLVSCALIRRLQ